VVRTSPAGPSELHVRSSRTLLLFILTAILSIEIVGYRHYRSDMAAWRAVQQSLVSLHSALEREPAARLAMTIASARAAVDAFAAAAHRFPRDHRARLQAAQHGLQYLAIAAEGAHSIRNWEAMSVYSDVTKLLPRGCDGDHLAFSPALISEAFAVAGSYFIREAISATTQKERSNWQQGFYPPLDLARETAACQRVERATLRLAVDRRKAGDPAHIAKWKYHIEISNPTGCLITPYSDDQVIPVPHSEVYRFHLDANRRARLEKVFCNPDKPADAIAVSINGQSYDPVWLLDDSGINYATQLVPRSPLAITPDGSP
jgi:hypothetical protein